MDESPPSCPAWLLPEAKAHWASVAPSLIADGMLSLLELPGFANYCQCYAQWSLAEQAVARDGPVTSDGKLNPMVRVADLYSKQLRAYSVEFGFTPSARGRIVQPPPRTDETDELAEFINP